MRCQSTFLTSKPVEMQKAQYFAGPVHQLQEIIWIFCGVVAVLLRSSGRRVRMVLAYGSGRYAKALRLLGKVLLNGQLEGLRKRLSLDEYYRYLAECTVVVYNQIRIESTGNVVLSFLMGHRVLMRRESHLYKRYSSMGFVVGDASARELDLSPLGDEDRRHNRELVLRSFGDEAVNARFDVFMADLLNVAGRNKT